MNETPVFMSKEDAEQFLVFQRHYDAIAFLINSGVFSLHQANAVLSFDAGGKLKSVKTENYHYNKEV